MLDPIEQDITRMEEERAARRLMHALYWRIAFGVLTLWLTIGAFGIGGALGVGWPSTLLNALVGPGLLLVTLVQLCYFLGIWFERWLDEAAKVGK